MIDDSYFLPGGILDPEDSKQQQQQRKQQQQQQQQQQNQVGVALGSRSSATLNHATSHIVDNSIISFQNNESNNIGTDSTQLSMDHFGSSHNPVAFEAGEHCSRLQIEMQQGRPSSQQQQQQQQQGASINPFRSRLDETYNSAAVKSPSLQYSLDNTSNTDMVNNIGNQYMKNDNNNTNGNENNNIKNTIDGNAHINSFLLSAISDRPGVSGLDPTGDDVVNAVARQSLLTATGLHSVMDNAVRGTGISTENGGMLTATNSGKSDLNGIVGITTNNYDSGNINMDTSRFDTVPNQQMSIPDWLASTTNTAKNNIKMDDIDDRQFQHHNSHTYHQPVQQQRHLPQQQLQQQQQSSSNTNSGAGFFSAQQHQQHDVVTPLGQPATSTTSNPNLETLLLGAFASPASTLQQSHQHQHHQQGDNSMISNYTVSNNNHSLVDVNTGKINKNGNNNVSNGGNNNRGSLSGGTGIKRLPSSTGLSKDATTICISGSSSNDSRTNNNNLIHHRPNQNPWSQDISSVRNSTTSSVVTPLHHTGRYGNAGSIGGVGDDQISSTAGAIGSGNCGRRGNLSTSSSSTSILAQKCAARQHEHQHQQHQPLQQQQHSSMRPPPGFVPSSQNNLLPINQQQQHQQEAQVLMRPRLNYDISGNNDDVTKYNTNNCNGHNGKGRQVNDNATYQMRIGNEPVRGTARNSTNPQLRQQQRHQHLPQHQQQLHSSVSRMKKNSQPSSQLHYQTQNEQQTLQQHHQHHQQHQQDNADTIDQRSHNSRGVPCTIYVVDEDAVSNSEDTLTVCADSVTESSQAGMVHPHSHQLPAVKTSSGGVGTGAAMVGNANKYVDNGDRMDVLEETSCSVEMQKRTKAKRQKKRRNKKRHDLQTEVNHDDSVSQGGSTQVDENHRDDDQVMESKNDNTSNLRLSKNVKTEKTSYKAETTVASGDEVIDSSVPIPSANILGSNTTATSTIVQRKPAKRAVKCGLRQNDNSRLHGRDKGEHGKLKRASNRKMKPREPLQETLIKVLQTMKPILVDIMRFCLVKSKSLAKALFWSIVFMFPKKERFWFLMPLFCIVMDISYLTVCLTFQGIGKVVYLILLTHKLALVEMLESDSAALCYVLACTYPGIALTIMEQIPHLPYGSSFVGWYIIVRWMCRPIHMSETFLNRIKLQERQRNAMTLMKRATNGGNENVKSVTEMARIMKEAGEEEDMEETERVKVANQILNICRKLIPVMLLLEGTTNGQGVIMSMSRCERIFLGYACAVARSGYIFSPLIWLSFTFQLLFVLCCPSTIICGHILFLLGLASIRLTHYTSSVEDFKARSRNRTF